MPVAGRKPKPDGQAVNRMKPAHDWVDVENVPFDGASPDLPGDVVWSERAERRWAVVRSLPHAKLWHAGDWESALDYIQVLEQHWEDPTAELRIRERGIGLTTDALRDLRIRYVEPSTGDVDATVTQINDYREL